ncbi:MAG: hypothetical protein MUF54_01885 [Polyangiaceae bacterium]|jgi:hypothetical protein|nr:hypothetical protein [Polyangiaceae bacterium]
MTLDVVLVVTVTTTFALLVTMQVTILAGLVHRKQYWHSLAALLLPVLAPYWAFAEGMRVRAWLWIASALSYAACLAFTLWRG